MSYEKLLAAAQALVDRWDQPAWKDVPHTANYVNNLREALADGSQSCGPCCNRPGQDVLDELRAAAARKWQGDPAAQRAGLFARAADEVQRLREENVGLYAAPQAPKPLTDEQIEAMLRDNFGYADHMTFARAVEAAHGIKP